MLFISDRREELGLERRDPVFGGVGVLCDRAEVGQLADGRGRVSWSIVGKLGGSVL